MKKPIKPETEVGRGTTIRGRLTGNESLAISGRVLGEIDLAAALVIKKTGFVQGDVTADDVEIQGTVVGDVQGRRLVRLTAGAQVKGDVSAPTVLFEEGARMQGRLSSGDAESDRPALPQYVPVESPTEIGQPLEEVVMRPLHVEKKKRRVMVKKKS